jgi:hypothetical protein
MALIIQLIIKKIPTLFLELPKKDTESKQS